MDNLNKLLSSEIEASFEVLDELPFGTEEHTAGVNDLMKMMDRAIEIQKLESEEKIKTIELESEKMNNWIRNGIEVFGIVVPTAVTIWGTLKSFKFEETGNVTTILGRLHVQNLLKKR